jgi:uncharacterized membrane protein
VADPDDVTARSPASRGASLALLAIALVAVALRAYGLGRESLWLDEGFSWRLSQLAPAQALAASARDVHPPLYALLLGGWARLFGASEAALRSLSALASCVAVLFTWRLARRAFGEGAGLAAAALVALSPLQVRYAQEARSYALLGALALVSADAWCEALETGRVRARLVWAFSTLALLYTHAYGIFVLFAELLALAWWLRRPEGRRAARALALPAGFVAAGFLPWAAVLGRQVASVSREFWIARPVPFDLARTLFEFAGSAPLLVLLGPLALIGLVQPSARGAGKPGAGRALVVALALVPLLVPFAISSVAAPIYLTRAAIPAALALAILAAAGWAALPTRARALAALAVIATSVPALAAHHRGIYKEPWRDAVAWLERDARPGDLVVICSPWYRDGVWAYYAKRHDLDVQAFPPHGGAVTAGDIAALAPRLAAHPRAWLVRARADDPEQRLPAALEAGRTRVASREWTVIPAGLTRRREVRAFEIFCYAAADSSSPPSPRALPGAEN